MVFRHASDSDAYAMGAMLPEAFVEKRSS